MNNHSNDTESNNNTVLKKMALRKEEMIFKQMTDNTDEALPIVIDRENSFSINSYARGYHAYMKICNLLMEKCWFVREKLIILMIATLFSSFVFRMLQAIFLWV